MPDPSSFLVSTLGVPHVSPPLRDMGISLLCTRMRLIVDLQHMLHGELSVALRGRQSLVTEQLLDRPQVGAFLQHVSAKSMTQSVRMNIRREALGYSNLLNNAPHASRSKPPAALVDQKSGRILADLSQ